MSGSLSPMLFEISQTMNQTRVTAGHYALLSKHFAVVVAQLAFKPR